ncbi:hypothetical protein [Kitasatospora sp. NBC_00458]|uniref:hypothetical protein n=1 Tax=Kitasatospora sp. NBC_00458 TaxID=2903568 RepID=UPI002E174E20
MNELIFRGRDRYRPSKALFVLLLAVFVAQGAFAAYRLGPVGGAWLIGGTIALLAPFAYSTVRCWSAVGPAGITVCWGFGRGRTYPWHEIRWIDVRTTTNRGSESLAARMFLTSGRRRALPGLQHSDLYPDPDFDVDFRRVVNWWELNTDEASRVRPPRSLRDRLTPTVLAVLVTAVVAAAAWVDIVVLH